MFKHFGDAWGFQYSEDDFKGQVEKYNLYEINIG